MSQTATSRTKPVPPWAMWTPPNQHGIPSQAEVLQTKISISKLENELAVAAVAPEQTQRCIAELERDLDQQRAWIAPIRKIPFEVLSEVFVICSRSERLAPVVIGGVCRRWRDIVLGTPAAWVWVYPQNQTDKTLPLEYVEMFLARSNPHKLHMRIPSPSYYRGCGRYDRRNVEYIFRQSHRIQCLTANSLWFKEFSTTVFPDLVRLTVDRADVELDGPLEMSRFPCLRYLKLPGYSDINKAIDFSGVPRPQLLYLDLIVDRDGNWAHLIALCASTLKALKVHTGLGDFNTDRQLFDCPELEYLSVIDILRRDSGDPPGFVIKAPMLISYTYLAGQGNPAEIYHCDARNILHLCTNRTVALFDYPRLRVLQIQALSTLFEAVIQLERDPSLCGSLKRIEILYDVTKVQDRLAEARHGLDDRNQRACSNITIHTEHVANEFNHAYSCGDGMPCNPW